jgi:hypothetical protein
LPATSTSSSLTRRWYRFFLTIVHHIFPSLRLMTRWLALSQISTERRSRRLTLRRMGTWICSSLLARSSFLLSFRITRSRAPANLSQENTCVAEINQLVKLPKLRSYKSLQLELGKEGGQKSQTGNAAAEAEDVTGLAAASSKATAVLGNVCVVQYFIDSDMTIHSAMRRRPSTRRVCCSLG